MAINNFFGGGRQLKPEPGTRDRIRLDGIRSRVEAFGTFGYSK